LALVLLGLRPGVWSPYTEEDWTIALAKFDKALESAELKVAEKLRLQLRHLSSNTLQVSNYYMDSSIGMGYLKNPIQH